jgi:hypothetical protein
MKFDVLTGIKKMCNFSEVIFFEVYKKQDVRFKNVASHFIVTTSDPHWS